MSQALLEKISFKLMKSPQFKKIKEEMCAEQGNGKVEQCYHIHRQAETLAD